jgi:hypothetical protein
VYNLSCLDRRGHRFTRSCRRVAQEMSILLVLSMSSILCGGALAAVAKRNDAKAIVPLRLAGSVFVLGFVLLGVAISHWRFG